MCLKMKKDGDGLALMVVSREREGRRGVFVGFGPSDVILMEICWVLHVYMVDYFEVACIS